MKTLSTSLSLIYMYCKMYCICVCLELSYIRAAYSETIGCDANRQRCTRFRVHKLQKYHHDCRIRAEKLCAFKIYSYFCSQKQKGRDEC